MTIRFGKIVRSLFPTIALLAVSSQSMASTLNQNVSWTIDRTGTTAKYRVVAYGDSIYAGYNGSTSNAAKYAGTTVESEYLSALWNTDVENVRRAKSGAIASRKSAFGEFRRSADCSEYDRVSRYAQKHRRRGRHWATALSRRRHITRIISNRSAAESE